jgi:hypothetical protein
MFGVSRGLLAKDLIEAGLLTKEDVIEVVPQYKGLI